MKILTFLKLWVAERSLKRIAAEIAAGRAYVHSAEQAYEEELAYECASRNFWDWGNRSWDRHLAEEDLLDARERVGALEEEHLYVLAKIAELRTQP